MQKIVSIDVLPPRGEFDEINKMLNEGWKVVEIHPLQPIKGESTHTVLVLIEKEDKN